MKKKVVGFFTGIAIVLILGGCQSSQAKESPEPVAQAEVPRAAPGSLLPITGADNVRDMGGYRAADGKLVRWDQVIRAGELNKLESEDVAFFEALGIKTIVDFRDDGEKAEAPDAAIGTVVHTYYFPIEVGSLLDVRTLARASAEQNAGILVEGNKFFATGTQDQYRAFFGLLQDEANLPLLFHCTAGKDRAGFAAALFLSSLGVDRETIIADYLLSGDYVKAKYAAYVSRMPGLAPIFETRREYITAAFETIDSQYGGIEKYLTNNLGVDLNKMKRIYTK
jgi:protein-tyrosine phosphatase